MVARPCVAFNGNRAVSHETTTATPMGMATMAIALLLLFCCMIYTAIRRGGIAMAAAGNKNKSAFIWSMSPLGARAGGGGAIGSSITAATRSFTVRAKQARI